MCTPEDEDFHDLIAERNGRPLSRKARSRVEAHQRYLGVHHGSAVLPCAVKEPAVFGVMAPAEGAWFGHRTWTAAALAVEHDGRRTRRFAGDQALRRRAFCSSRTHHPIP